MTDVAISVRDVSKCYRVFDDQRSRLLHAMWPSHTKGMQEVWALRDINFEIKRGEAVAIIGRNGGGKSTLLEILTGTLTPTTGEVIVNGRVSALLELGSGFNPEYSGRDNVILNGLLLGLSREEILGRFDEIEAFAEIGVAIDRPVKTYSSGMMMRLAFAVQVLCDPEILIIDEALSVGDFFFQQKCMGHIRGLCDRGVTLLFVSHDMGAVAQICSQAIYLKKGRLAQKGGVTSVTHSYFNEATTYGDLSNPFAMSPGLLEISHTSNISLAEYEKGVVWSRPVESSENAHILSIAFFSQEGIPATKFVLGTQLKVIVRYIPDVSRGTHLTVGLNDRYGKLCAGSGTAQIGLAPKVSEESRTSVFVELNFDLLLEAGQYSVFGVLGYLEAPNHGQRFDITPDIGPISVSWDYENSTVPFVGAMGLPVAGGYVNVV